MAVPWSEIPARKRAKVGKMIAAHEFCKRLPYLPYSTPESDQSGKVPSHTIMGRMTAPGSELSTHAWWQRDVVGRVLGHHEEHEKCSGPVIVDTSQRVNYTSERGAANGTRHPKKSDGLLCERNEVEYLRCVIDE